MDGIYLGPHGTKASKLEYDRLIGEWLAGGRRLVDESAPDEITIGEICVDYTKKAKDHYWKNGKQTSEFVHVHLAMRELRQLYGNYPAIEFGPIKFKAFRERYIARGLQRQTVNHYLIHIVKAFHLAAENEKLPVSDYQSLQAVGRLMNGRSKAKEGTPVRPVEISVVEATLLHLRPIIADMVRLQIFTGMRPSEVCNLRPIDIDRTRDVWVDVFDDHKTEHHSKKRLIHIGPEAQRVLAPYLLRDERSYCFSPKESMEQHRREKRLKLPDPFFQRATPETRPRV